MSEHATWEPPVRGRLNPQTVQAEGVDAPESKDVGIVTPEAKVAAVESPKPQGVRPLKGAMKIECVEIIPSKTVFVFSDADRVLFEAQEDVIAKYIGAFLLVGEALAVIKGRELQRIWNPKLTFDEYCSKKWGFGATYAYRLISGYECVQNLKDQMAPQGVAVFPTNEAQVRPLTSLLPKDQVKAWSQVLKKADGNVTATLVFNIVKGVSAKKSDKTTAGKEASGAGAEAEQKKLNAIAKLVEKALSVKPAKRSIKGLSEVLEKIQGLL
jgi:hypothetical protein